MTPLPSQLVFITEYMTSGSLLQFLKTKKRNTATVAGEMSKKTSKVRELLLKSHFWGIWRCVSVAVSPDAIHQYVKTKNEDQRWLHYIAPEYASSECGEGRGGEGRGGEGVRM